MNINATLFGQMITFAIFVWFTMKFIWPHLTRAMQEREKKIADGLAAAEKGQRNLELAQHKSVEMLHAAKIKAAEIVDHSHKRGINVIEEAKENAREESKRLLAMAQAEIEQQKQLLKEDLQTQVAIIAVTIAEKILQREIDTKAHKQLLNKIVAELR